MKFNEMGDHDILVIVAETTERQERHLETLNGTVSRQDRRITKIELRRELEAEMGFSPPSKKKKALEGSMYGGGGALVVGILITAGKYMGWW